LVVVFFIVGSSLSLNETRILPQTGM